MPELHAWMNANLESTGGGSGSFTSQTLTDSVGIDADGHPVVFANASTFSATTAGLSSIFIGLDGRGDEVLYLRSANSTVFQASSTTAFFGVKSTGISVDIDRSAIVLELSLIPEYADDAAAILAERPSGSLYRTEVAGSTFIKIVPSY